jgi:hypothetical protein
MLIIAISIIYVVGMYTRIYQLCKNVDENPGLFDCWGSLMFSLDAVFWPISTPYHLMGRAFDQLMLPPGDAP